MFAGIPRSSMKTFFWACDGCVNSASGFHLKRLVAGDVPGLGSCVSAMRHLSGSFQAFRILKCFLDLEPPPKKSRTPTAIYRSSNSGSPTNGQTNPHSRWGDCSLGYVRRYGVYKHMACACIQFNSHSSQFSHSFIAPDAIRAIRQ